MWTTIDEHVGQRITLARKAAGMTVVTLADEVGVSRQAMHDYINGTTRLRVDTLWHIAQLFELDMNWFFKGAMDG